MNFLRGFPRNVAGAFNPRIQNPRNVIGASCAVATVLVIATGVAAGVVATPVLGAEALATRAMRPMVNTWASTPDKTLPFLQKGYARLSEALKAPNALEKLQMLLRGKNGDTAKNILNTAQALKP